MADNCNSLKMVVKKRDLDIILEEVPLEQIHDVFFPAVEKVLEANGLTNADLRTYLTKFTNLQEFSTVKRLFKEVAAILGYLHEEVGELIINAFDEDRNGPVTGCKYRVEFKRDNLRKIFSDRN